MSFSIWLLNTGMYLMGIVVIILIANHFNRKALNRYMTMMDEYHQTLIQQWEIMDKMNQELAKNEHSHGTR